MKKSISREFLDIDHFRQQLRGWDTPAIQIGPGPIRIRLHSIDLGGLIFSDIRLNRKIIDHSRVQDGWYDFVVNFSPAIFCGRELAAGHLIVLAPGREHRSLLPSDWHSIAIVVSASALADEGIRPAPHLLSDPATASIVLPVELVRTFRKLTNRAFAGQQEEPIETPWLRRALFRALDKALAVGAGGRHPRNSLQEVEGYGLTLRMIRHIEGGFGKRITVNELAAALNVTPRALHYSTRSTLGMSPLDVILAFRLGHVRCELWDTRHLEANITHAALMQDFGHLGRFSQQYRSLFGELPSQTLQRIRALADCPAGACSASLSAV